MAAEKVFIVGIGDDGIEGMTAHAVKIVESASILLGPDSCSPLLSTDMQGRLQIVSSLEELVDRIEGSDGQQKIVVLASGDPLFYGTARYVCAKLGKGEIRSCSSCK